MRYSLGLRGGKLDYYYAELDGLYPTEQGGLRVPDRDLSPAPNWLEVERDGDPLGWTAFNPLLRVGWWPFLTMPGRRASKVVNGVETVPVDQQRPPRDTLLFVQGQTPTSLDEAWIATGPVEPGGMPLRSGFAELPPGPTPLYAVVPITDAGLKSAMYGWAYGFADEQFKLTPPSAYAFTASPIGEGQGLRFPLPDVSGANSPYLYFAVTLPDQGSASGRIMGFVDLREVLFATHSFPGPLSDNGKKPPTKNQTGVGKLPPVAVGNHRPGSKSRAWAHETDGPKGFGIQAARYRFYLIVKPKDAIGPSLPGIPSREVRIEGDIEVTRKEIKPEDNDTGEDGTTTNDRGEEETRETDPNDGKRFKTTRKQTSVKKGRVFRLFPPRNLPKDWEFGFVVQMVPEQGAAAYYTPGLTNIRGRTNMFQADGHYAKEGIPVYGYASDAAPGRIEIRLYSYERPEEDGTVIPAPDPTARPDAPYGYGLLDLIPASYRSAVADAVEGYPGEGPVGVSTDEIAVNNGQTIKLRRPSELKGLKNAIGSERSPKGDPADWTKANLGGQNDVTQETVVDGIFTYSAPSNHASGSSGEGFWKRATSWHELENGQESNFNVVGTLEVLEHFTGASQAQAQFQYDDGSTSEHDLTTERGQTMRLDGVGLRTLLHRGMPWGPNTANAIPAGALRVRVRFSPDLTLSAWRQVAAFRDFEVFPFVDALRKQENTYPDADDVEAGQRPADPDNVSSAAPFPSQTGWWLGPSPQVVGAPPIDVNPMGVWDFAGGVIPSSLGTLFSDPAPLTNAPVIEADPTSPTGSGYSLSVFDNSTGANAGRYWRKDYLDSEIEGDDGAAHRVLFRVPPTGTGLPTRGELVILQSLDQTSAHKPFGQVRITAGGAVKLVRQKPDGSVAESVVILSGVTPGSLVDAELIVGGENTKNGSLRASAGVNGPRRSSRSFTGLDYRNRKARRRLFGGVRETDGGARWRLWIYSFVDTPSGDVSNRETPAPSSLNLAPDPDAPPLLDRPADWSARAVKAAGALITPAPTNAHQYEAMNAGRTGPNAPVFPTDAGATVRDNAGLAPVPDDTLVALNTGVLKPGGSSSDAEWYQVTSAGRSAVAGAHPAYPTTDGATVKERADVARVDVVEIPNVVGNADYILNINGTQITFTSGNTPTRAIIATGLANAINASAQAPNVTASASATSVTVTSDAAGVDFTLTVANTARLTSSTTTPNVFGAVLTTRKTVVWQEDGVVWRLLDARGQKLNQWSGVIEPSMGQGRGFGPRTLRPIVVMPGETYTQAVQGRYSLFGVPELPSHQFFVVLTREGGTDPLYVGSPFGTGSESAAVLRVAGSRARTTDDLGNPIDAEGMGDRRDWAKEDFWHSFTVPAWDPLADAGVLPYTEAHVLPRDDAPGLYFFQEHGFFIGHHPTQEGRDAERAGGKKYESGTFRATIDTRLIGAELSPSPLQGQQTIGFGASHGDPEAAALPWTSRSTDVRSPYGGAGGTGWSQEAADPKATPGRGVVQIAGTLGEDPTTGEYPEMPAGSIYVETRPLAPVLLDANRMPLPGGILAGPTEVFDRSELNEEPVDGHAFSLRISDKVEALDPFVLLGFTTEAWRFLKGLSPDDLLVYEDPWGGDDGLGRAYTIRFFSRPQVERRAFPVRVFNGIKRTYCAVTPTPEAEVVQVAVLGPARGY